MTIKQLHYFVAVAETLSFTRAARRFYVAQTAISQQIASLEKELGIQLFRRDNRHVELTEAGSAFYQEIRPLVIRLENAVRTAAEAGRTEERQFRIGLTPEVPSRLLAPLLRAFHTQYPELLLNLQCDSVQGLSRPLKNADLDAALMVGEAAIDPRLVSEIPLTLVQQPPFCLAVYPGHPAYTAERLPWESLAGESVILCRDVTLAPGFSEIEPYLERLSGGHSADTMGGVLALTSAELGVALVPASSYGQVPPSLRLIPPEPCPAPRPFALYYHRNNSGPELDSFIALCRDSFGPNPPLRREQTQEP